MTATQRENYERADSRADATALFLRVARFLLLLGKLIVLAFGNIRGKIKTKKKKSIPVSLKSPAKYVTSRFAFSRAHIDG